MSDIPENVDLIENSEDTLDLPIIPEKHKPQ